MKHNVVILTLSEKWGKHCVAAYDTDSGRLVRIVSNAKNGAGIPKYLTNSISLLDVVSVEIVSYCPLEHQTENVLIDMNYGIRKLNRSMKKDDIYQLCTCSSVVFGDTNYKIQDAQVLNHSLEIVKFSNMTFSSGKNTKGETKSKASFSINGCWHSNYAITDSRYYLATENIRSGYAVISLPPSDNFTNNDGGFYKYISAIYE